MAGYLKRFTKIVKLGGSVFYTVHTQVPPNPTLKSELGQVRSDDVRMMPDLGRIRSRIQRTNLNPNLIPDSESCVVESDLESESCRFESESHSDS